MSSGGEARRKISVSDPSLSAGRMSPGYDPCRLQRITDPILKMVAEADFSLVPLEIDQIERGRSVDDVTCQLDVPGH